MFFVCFWSRSSSYSPVWLGAQRIDQTLNCGSPAALPSWVLGLWAWAITSCLLGIALLNRGHPLVTAVVSFWFNRYDCLGRMCVRSHSLRQSFPPSFCSHLWLDNSFLWDTVLCIVGCWHPNLYLLSADNISGHHRCSCENIQRYQTFHCFLGFLRVQSTSLEKNCMLDPEVDSGIPSWEVLADGTSGWLSDPG